MTRKFRHALTGCSIATLPGSRLERLVEADAQWVEDKPEPPKVQKSESKPGGSRGTGNGGRRRNTTRKVDDGSGSDEG